MLGYAPEELASFTLSDIWPDETERERFVRSIGGRNAVADFPADLICRDGTLLPVAIAAASLSDTDITCIVSARHPGAWEFPGGEEYLQVFDSLIDAVIILDRDGDILFANTAVATLTGVSSPAELIGQNPLQFAHPDYKEAVVRNLANLCSGHGGRLIHYPMQDLHGNERWVEALGTKILFKGRDANLVVLRDITERKSVESELARTNQRFRDLYRLVRMMCDNVPDLIWAKDTERRTLCEQGHLRETPQRCRYHEPLGRTDMFLPARTAIPPGRPPGTPSEDLPTDAIVMESGKAERSTLMRNVREALLDVQGRSGTTMDDDRDWGAAAT